MDNTNFFKVLVLPFIHIFKHRCYDYILNYIIIIIIVGNPISGLFLKTKVVGHKFKIINCEHFKCKLILSK